MHSQGLRLVQFPGPIHLSVPSVQSDPPIRHLCPQSFAVAHCFLGHRVSTFWISFYQFRHHPLSVWRNKRCKHIRFLLWSYYVPASFPHILSPEKHADIRIVLSFLHLPIKKAPQLGELQGSKKQKLLTVSPTTLVSLY